MSEYRLLLGDCLEVMRGMDADSVDAICTDPPYGLSDHKPDDVIDCLRAWLAGEPYKPNKRGFMGKGWDGWPPGPEVWRECLRVLRPGGHMLCFAGTRSMDLMSMAIRLAGFELRDTLMWLHGQGFAKGINIGKAIDKATGAEREVIGRYQPPNGKEWNLQHDNGGGFVSVGHASRAESLNVTAPATDAARQWDGWNSQLKPSFEPIIMARKPLSEPTIAANVLRWGTGAINVDGCRIGHDEPLGKPSTGMAGKRAGIMGETVLRHRENTGPNTQGRWPANLLLDEAAAALLDEMSGLRKSGGGNKSRRGNTAHTAVYGTYNAPPPDIREVDVGHASRYFLRVAPDADDEPLRMAYIAKASKRDRDEGLDGMPLHDGPIHLDGGPWKENKTAQNGEQQRIPRANHHPTVKSTPLMRWLVRLVTPPGGTVLDPFMGSGSTGKACMLEGFDFVGVELDEEYLAIARARIEHALAGALRARRLELAAAQMPLFAEGIL